ncbi:hypothetical protein D3C86_1961650 [compost metagenome]
MLKQIGLWSFAVLMMASMSHGDTQKKPAPVKESAEWSIEKVSSFKNMTDQCIPSRYSKTPNILPKAKCRMG